ncbi:MAG TPA: beta-galactosidase trimerization domain-containing protein [Steroidobacteraceae bacterium]|nr:beta-galactosidase trimerization domain-containing protein [Steroidobacteraceae bacterium]
MSTISRRNLLQLGAMAAALNAVRLPATPRIRGGGPAEEGWQTRSYRWIQVAFTEDDPGNYDPDFWLRYFQQIRAQGACLSAGGAIAFYPTDVPFHQRSSYLGAGDSFGEMVRGCRRLGMAVIGRIDPHSMNEAAYAAHPEWVARLADGSPMRHWADPSRYVTCAHGPYNFEFMPRVIREIVERYRVDAIFGNRWDGHTVCHCASCQRLFREATGFAVPETMDPSDKVRRAYMVWENEHLFSLVDMWTATIRKSQPGGFFMPGSSSRPQPRMEFDPRRLAAIAFLTVDRQGRAGNTPAWINGRNAKVHRAFMGTKPVANIFSIGLEEVFRWKDSVQSPAEIRLWLAEGIAQGFRPWLCKFNAKPFDKRWMPVVADVYQWHATNQRYLTPGANLARVAIVVSNQTAAFYDRRQQNAEADGAQFGYYQALIESRIPFEIVDDHFLEAGSLARFRVLILPNIAALCDAQCSQLAEYVHLGGRIIATHETSLYDEWGVQRPDFGLSELFGCSYAGRTDKNVRNSYLSTQPGHALTRGLEDTPRIIGATGYVAVKPHAGDAISALTLIPSYPDLPMESVYPRDTATRISMAYCRDVGRGRVVYLPMDIDRCFWQVMNPDHLLVLRNAVAWAADEASFVSVFGPGILDIACWRQHDCITIHLVNLTNPMLLKGPFRELIQMGPYRVRLTLPPDVAVKKVHSLATGSDLATTLRDRELTVEVPSILLHEVLVIDS